MRNTLALLTTVVLISGAEAQIVYGFPDTLAVVSSGKMNRIGAISHIDADCRDLGYSDVVVVKPPLNGTVFTNHLPSEHPIFPIGTDHYHCNKLKRPAVGVMYKPNPGFRVIDHVTIRWMDENHTPVFKPYTLQVE